MIWLAFGIIGVPYLLVNSMSALTQRVEKGFPLSEVMNRSQCETLVFNESMPWENAKLNFDNVGISFLSLLQVVSTCLQF